MRPPAAVTPKSVNAPLRGRATALGVSLIGIVVVLLATLVPVPASAQTSEEEAQQAAREIQDARDRANAAADAFFQARSDLELLEEDAEGLESEAAALEVTVERLRHDVESLAVARFASSGSNGIPLLTGLQAPKDQVQAEVLVGVVTNAGGNALDEYDIAQKELVAKQDELVEQKADIERQQVVFSELQEAAEAEVERLRRVEEQRLTDVAVQRALDAQLEAAISRLEETSIENAEAAKKAQPNPGIAAAAEAVAAAEAAAAADGADGGDADGAVIFVPPVETIAPNTGASGGSSGGRTGTGGIGSSPAAILNDSGYVDAIMCPMSGSAYGDSWGGPRSGGRRHEGVDMLAPAGTPIIAVTSGIVTFKQNALGGNAVSLAGDNGNRYYYAHLSGYEGTSRRVIQGEVIGYNGDTGNATGIPHLHFEVHPGGGLAVNPTPSVRAAGC
jgi:murein DD-endopeptidase MepM/ murein hydrolase activator NlpD